MGSFLNSLFPPKQPTFPQNGREFNSQRKQIPTIMELKQNPIDLLRKEGYKIPDSMTDPEQLSKYLIQSGQVRDRRLQLLQRVLASFK